VDALQKQVGCKQKVVGAATRSIDGTIVAYSGDDGRRRRDFDQSTEALGNGSFVLQAAV
jgi:hypothetical protein